MEYFTELVMVHIPGSFLAVNKVDGALVEATAFLVCRRETSTGLLTVNFVDGKAW